MHAEGTEPLCTKTKWFKTPRRDTKMGQDQDETQDTQVRDREEKVKPATDGNSDNGDSCLPRLNCHARKLLLGPLV